MQLSFIPSIHQVEPERWDACWHSSYPFCRHGFLAALEDSASVGGESGWRPHHGLITQHGRLVGVVPLFEKTHSYGEYVFDWAWADAYARYGLPYYPKLINAIPFTPSTGPRLGLAGLGQAEQERAVTALHNALAEQAVHQGYSGWHSLFPDAASQTLLEFTPLITRHGCQFHWFNNGYGDLEEFLASFSSRKRKNVKKERAKVAASSLRLLCRSGRDVSSQEWQHFYALYQRTYLKRSGGYGYLGSSFFAQLAQTMPDNVLLVSAHLGAPGGKSDVMVAAAFYLRDKSTLYGRYWGAIDEYDTLHFEACYYQGIDYAIREGLQRFDPGAQGEHKIQRGFTPVTTCSRHWLADSRFAEAVTEFCEAEAHHVEQYIRDARRLLPYREGGNPVGPGALLSEQTHAR